MVQALSKMVQLYFCRELNNLSQSLKEIRLKDFLSLLSVMNFSPKILGKSERYKRPIELGDFGMRYKGNGIPGSCQSGQFFGGMDNQSSDFLTNSNRLNGMAFCARNDEDRSQSQERTINPSKFNVSSIYVNYLSPF